MVHSTNASRNDRTCTTMKQRGKENQSFFFHAAIMIDVPRANKTRSARRRQWRSRTHHTLVVEVEIYSRFSSNHNRDRQIPLFMPMDFCLFFVRTKTLLTIFSTPAFVNFVMDNSLVFSLPLHFRLWHHPRKSPEYVVRTEKRARHRTCFSV